MKKETIVFGIAGVFFGFLIGWIIGSQQGSGARPTMDAPTQQASAGGPAASQAQPAIPLDESRVAALRATADQNPKDAETRILLGNLYFDAERYQEATQWYEAALKVQPKNANASTDLGIAYYYMNQPDRALTQFERSLEMDPKHSKTLLNMGIVRAFGKQDLEGAAKAWERVLQIAPGTPEAGMAQQALDGLRKAHPR